MTDPALVCGVDEAGRGPLAGPVFAAAVILGGAPRIEGVTDSKLLTPRRRTMLATEIKARALSWSIASASVAEIDTLNILRASLLAMQRAVDGLAIVPALALIDGLHCPVLACAATAVVKGDASVAEISAASILAKVARDAEMLDAHRQFPQYGFDRHKGYPTPQHLAALQRHGVTPVHRTSFAPVRAVIALAARDDGVSGW